MSGLCMMYALNGLLTNQKKKGSAKGKLINLYNKDTYRDLANKFDLMSGMGGKITFDKKLYYINHNNDNIFRYGLRKNNILTEMEIYQRGDIKDEALLKALLNLNTLVGIVFHNQGHSWSYRQGIIYDNGKKNNIQPNKLFQMVKKHFSIFFYEIISSSSLS